MNVINTELTYPIIYINFKGPFEALQDKLEIRLSGVHCPMCKTNNVIIAVQDIGACEVFYTVCKNCWHLVGRDVSPKEMLKKTKVQK